jgi:hypothetical protein
MMRYDAGAKTVVVGGRPGPGPMQATGGTRGARSYSISKLDSDMENARSFAKYLNSTAPIFPDRTNDIFIFSASINLRDSLRKGLEMPLQFVYDAADCRLYFTHDTLFNQTALWLHAAEAIETPGSSCVTGSTVNTPPIPVLHLTHEEPQVDSTEPSLVLNDQLLEDIVNQGDQGNQASLEDRTLAAKGTDCTHKRVCNNIGDQNMKCVQVPDCKVTIIRVERVKGVERVKEVELAKRVCVPGCFEDTYCTESVDLKHSVLTGTCKGYTASKDTFSSPRDDNWGYCAPSVVKVCGKLNTLTGKRSEMFLEV